MTVIGGGNLQTVWGPGYSTPLFSPPVDTVAHPNLLISAMYSTVLYQNKERFHGVMAIGNKHLLNANLYSNHFKFRFSDN